MQGPTLPSASDLVLARETASEYQDEERKYKRKREREEVKDRIEDMVGPKEVGREGMLEKKRARREGDRAFRDKGDDGMEADESTLLGGGDSFKERYVSCQQTWESSSKLFVLGLRNEMLQRNASNRKQVKRRRRLRYESVLQCSRKRKRPPWICSSN